MCYEIHEQVLVTDVFGYDCSQSRFSRAGNRRKENKAVVNKLEFNRKYSELTPPTLVIPPFSSAKDYKRLAGICFLGVGDCGSGITFGKGDDYTKPCETINPCTGFNLTNTASCTDGYTTCNTGCEDKFKCNPPQYTQTCEFPYQGVGTPKDGKYKSCECQAAFKYGTGDCPSPKVPDTSGTSCDGKYSSCICPSTYTEYCSSPYVGVGDSCDGKYQSCQCPATYTRDCESEGMSGVGDACNGLYEDCTTIACDEAYNQTCNYPYQGEGDSCDGKYKSCSCPASFSESCSAPYVGVGQSCNGLYQSCTCPNNYNKTCDGQNPVGSACDGLYSDCADKSCEELGYTETCNSAQKGVGEACDGKYKSCECRSDLVSCNSAGSGVGPSCGGLYTSCSCRSDLVSCKSPEVGSGASCGGRYESCTCPSSYSETCSGVYEGVGSSCNGKYQSCQCRSDLESCSGNYVGVGESCGGKYACLPVPTATLIRYAPAIRSVTTPAAANVPAAMFRVPAVQAEIFPAAAVAAAGAAATTTAWAFVTYGQAIVNYRACLKPDFQAGSFFPKNR